MSLIVIILAAGLGKRMRSQTPKVLHKLAGLSLLERVIQTSTQLNPDHIYVVVGHGREAIQSNLENLSVTWVEQKEQLGTGHAVSQVLPYLENPESQVLILYGDVPLIQKEILQDLLDKTLLHQLGLITTVTENPQGLGRIFREAGAIQKIIEERDATEEQKNIHEINSGITLTSVKNLKQWLPLLSSKNSQNELYLTDILELAVKERVKIVDFILSDPMEVMGVNDRCQLAKLERYYQHRCAQKYMESGVTIADPNRFDVRGELVITSDVFIDINVILEGKVSIASGVVIGPNCYLKNVMIGRNVEIRANCYIEDSEIGDDCVIGPFARLRQGVELKNKVIVGNFVEIKNSQIGSHSKIPHISYVGDAIFGEKVNFGAGAITCNYNGAIKQRTVIEDNAFIGSDSQLIAPVVIEEGAFIGAGSTITKDAPANKLTLARAKQQTIENWVRPKKEEK